jgi:hypothetical protein
MGKSPKAKDYGPTASETALSGVAKSQWARWKDNFEPALIKRAASTQTDAVDNAMSSRANADVMKGTTSKLSLGDAESLTASGDRAMALQGQAAAAHAAALKVKNGEGASVLARASGVGGSASEGLAMAAKLGVSSQLDRAKANQEVAQAKFNALTSVVASGAAGAYNNASMAGQSANGGKIGDMDWSKAFTPQIENGSEGGIAKYKPVEWYQGVFNSFKPTGGP